MPDETPDATADRPPLATIALLTRNSAATIGAVLEAIVAQEFTDYEILVIDSSSTDATVDIVSRFDIRLIVIDPADFGHGRTRNLAAHEARGDLVVFLTHDSIPRHPNWLTELLAPFADPVVAGAYGRQIPRDDEKPLDKYFFLSLYGDEPKVWRRGNWSAGDNISSNANSAMRTTLLRQHPFHADIIVSEDYEWASRLLELGYEIVYNPAASVTHSHHYTLGTLFKRNFDVGVSYRSIYTTPTSGGFLRKGLGIYWNEIRVLAANRYAHLIPMATFRDVVRLTAISLGRHETWFSTRVKARHLSAQTWYWKARP